MSDVVVQEIELDAIAPSPKNRRVGGIDEASLGQLAESIKSHGVKEPALVRPIPHKGHGPSYELVFGERRWRASRIAGKTTLPCLVEDLTDAEAAAVRIIENLHREDIHPLDEAEGYAELLETGSYDVEHIASELGKSVAYVYQRMKLRSLISEVRDLLVEGKLTAGHAILIARLEEPQQVEVFKEVKQPWRRDISIKDLDEWIRSNILMELSRATWKLTDEDLDPEAGACASCTKRTGHNPELFADIGTKDRCTDKACFARKGEAIVRVKKAELKDVEHLEVCDSYHRGKAEKGVLEQHQWKECKKKDEGAVRVLVVDGNQPGRLTYGKIQTYGRDEREESPEEKKAAKEQRAHEKNLKAARESLLLELFGAIRLELAKRRRQSKAKEAQGLAGIRCLEAETFWKFLGYDQWNYLATLEKWEKPEDGDWRASISKRIADMDGPDVEDFLVLCAFGAATKINPYQRYCIPEILLDAAALVGIDPDNYVEAAATTYGIPVTELDPEPEDEEDDEFEGEEEES